MSYISECATVKCREPFETNDGKDRIRVERYVVWPDGLYGSGKFVVFASGPVLTKSGAVHKGRRDGAASTKPDDVPQYVYEEAVEHFTAVAENLRQQFDSLASKCRERIKGKVGDAVPYVVQGGDVTHV